MDDEILLPDRQEAIAAVVAHTLREARIVGLELELRPVEPDDLGQFVQGQHAIEHEGLVGHHADLLGDERTQRGRHQAVVFEPDHRSTSTPLESGLEEEDEIFGLFLDFEIAVADHAERARSLQQVAGEQRLGEEPDQCFERNETRRAAFERRQVDEPFALRRQADQRLQHATVAGTNEFQRDREAEVGDEGKRMGGIDGERRQDRENMRMEVLFEPGHIGLAQVGRVGEHDAGIDEFGPQLAPPTLLFGGEMGDALADLHELFGRRQPILGGFRHALADLAAQTGDAHHEKLVEIVRRDRQEAQLLQQGVVAVRGLLQDAAVEFEPGELSIDETMGRTRQVVRACDEIVQRTRQGVDRRGIIASVGPGAPVKSDVAHLILHLITVLSSLTPTGRAGASAPPYH